MSDEWYKAWHYQPDALPFVVRIDTDKLELHIVTGTWSQYGPDTQQKVSLQWCILAADGPVGPPKDQDCERILTGDIKDPNAQQPPESVGERVPYRPHTISSSNLSTNGYYETVIPLPNAPTEIRYTITANATDLVTPKTLGPYRVVADDPKFHIDDMFGGRTGSFTDPAPSWIGFTRHEDEWLQMRLDLDDLPLDKEVAARIWIGTHSIDVDPTIVNDLAASGQCPQLPLVNWYTDIITVTVRSPLTGRGPRERPVDVEVYGRRMKVPRVKQNGTTRLLLAHFCIQGINDLLEVPFAGYAPARTYMQVTMRDEDGKYSSRPGRAPGKDGYSFGLDAQRRFKVPYHLALNGGVMTLMQHDCQNNAGALADDMQTIQQDIAAGLLHLANPGYGSHRVPYYSAATNTRDIGTCGQLQETLFGRSGDLIYLDQRLYRRDRQTLPTLKDTVPKYVVFDSNTGFYDNEKSIIPRSSGGITDLGPNCLWQDRKSRKRVLFIDDSLKDDAFSGTSFSVSPLILGKPGLALRQRFMRFALDPHLRDRNVLVYGDDFEKACGNGWFEGIPDMKEKFSAFLEWISAHEPWLQCITTDILDNDNEQPVGTIDVKTAIDPVLDPGGVKSRDIYGNLLHFDSWENDWFHYPAMWIDSFLGEITTQVERALTRWPPDYQENNELFETAWLSFLMCQHEDAWNKQPLEGSNPNTRLDGDPEDFTIVEGLQVRNTMVWLKASIWAHWAKQPKPKAQSADPLRDLIEALPPEVRGPGDADHWDADPMKTIVLYNEQALVVLDQNGGRVTHAFVIRDGQPVTVSGTFKSYQYRDAAGIDCDGPVLQNTVWTPNHRYIGSDLGLAQGPTTIKVLDNRPGSVALVDRVLPDNFNAYVSGPTSGHQSATFRYKKSRTQAPQNVTENQLAQLFRQDSAARRHGSRGEVVWHDDARSFSKTFALAGTMLTVSYSQAPPGHLVDNEFCVDLYGQLMGGLRMGPREVSADDMSVTLRALNAPARAGAVRVQCLRGCSFVPSSLLTDSGAAGTQLSEFLSIHRVLTDAVQIRAHNADAKPVDFSYQIDLNAAP